MSKATENFRVENTLRQKLGAKADDPTRGDSGHAAAVLAGVEVSRKKQEENHVVAALNRAAQRDHESQQVDVKALRDRNAYERERERMLRGSGVVHSRYGSWDVHHSPIRPPRHLRDFSNIPRSNDAQQQAPRSREEALLKSHGYDE